MQRPISAICAGVILVSGLVLAFAQSADDAQQKLQGTWTATKAERDGNAADDVVGHRLSFTGNRFQIISKDGKPLYAGTVRVNPSAKIRREPTTAGAASSLYTICYLGGAGNLHPNDAAVMGKCACVAGSMAP
jgi:hypothetical protein